MVFSIDIQSKPEETLSLYFRARRGTRRAIERAIGDDDVVHGLKVRSGVRRPCVDLDLDLDLASLCVCLCV